MPYPLATPLQERARCTVFGPAATCPICPIVSSACCRTLAQKTYVEQQLRLYNVRNVVVVTADEYQVYEQEVVLVDTVRTDMPGFLRGISREHGDGRAFNGRLVVATTRAKKAMVVIGSYFGMHMAGDLWRLYTYYEDRRRAFHWDGARAILSQITQDIRNRLIAAQGGRPSATRAGV